MSDSIPSTRADRFQEIAADPRYVSGKVIADAIGKSYSAFAAGVRQGVFRPAPMLDDPTTGMIWAAADAAALIARFK